jgi:hypothetical protein
MIAAREAACAGGAIVVMDRHGEFYPPAAAALGIDLDSLIVIRAANEKDEMWALDQALHCEGVAAVWAPIERIDWRSFRRLQLAAEVSGSLGLLLRSTRVRGQPSWADVQLVVQPRPLCLTSLSSRVRRGSPDPTRAQSGSPAPIAAETRRFRIQVTHCRNARSGGVVELEMDDRSVTVSEARHHDETHPLSLASQLVNPAPRRRSARA